MDAKTFRKKCKNVQFLGSTPPGYKKCVSLRHLPPRLVASNGPVQIFLEGVPSAPKNLAKFGACQRTWFILNFVAPARILTPAHRGVQISYRSSSEGRRRSSPAPASTLDMFLPRAANANVFVTSDDVRYL